MSSPAPENRPKTPNKQAPAARDTPSVPAIAPPGAAPAAGAYDMPVVAALSAKPQMQAPADLWAPTAARVPARPEGPVTAPHIASSLEEEPSGAAGLSAQYKVQAWETSMDCLWNIAAKPWVYGDPNKWIFLYRANSSKLPNPQNPHVVPPNIVLDIPSIDGEARQGLGSWNAP
jgi:nucleoid-associated protein YgaU